MGVGGQLHAPSALPPGKRHGTHCTGGWVGPSAGLDECGKSRPHRNSIPGPSSPSRYTDCAIAALRKATISFVISVCLSVRMEQLGSQWTDFHKIWYLRIFRKSVENIQVSLKSYKNNRYFTWRPMYIYDISLTSSYNEKYFRQNL
jgi:hypothetical protein